MWQPLPREVAALVARAGRVGPAPGGTGGRGWRSSGPPAGDGRRPSRPPRRGVDDGRRGCRGAAGVGGRWHVAVVVENVALGVDTRLRKQVDDLLRRRLPGLGRDPAPRRTTTRYRDVPGLTAAGVPRAARARRACSATCASTRVSFGWAAVPPAPAAAAGPHRRAPAVPAARHLLPAGLAAAAGRGTRSWSTSAT